MKKIIALLLLFLLLAAPSVQALDKTFTYQGVLNNGALPVPDGLYDLNFKLYEHQQNNIPPIPEQSSQVATPVTNGVFTVKLSFSNAPFDGRNYWLEISAKTNGAASFVTLAPRQMITPTPYSLYAMSAGAISGTLPAAQLPANVALIDRAQTFTANQSFARNVGIGPALGGTALSPTLVTSAGPMPPLFGDESTPASFGLSVDGNNVSLGLRARRTAIGTGWTSASIGLTYDVDNTVEAAGGLWLAPGRHVGDGYVGIGTASPQAKLHVATSGGVGVFSGNLGPFGNAEFESNVSTPNNHAHAWFAEDGNRVFSVGPGGEGFFAGDISMNGGRTIRSSGRLHIQANEDLYLNPFGGAGTVYVGGGGGPGNFHTVGSASVCSLTIRGGCDIAEPFRMSDQNIPKGAVVIIDENNPGHLKLSERACDTRVAGIVSGANGVNTGLMLKQEGVLDSGENVALSGRVYVQADASSAPIKPGDLLTTSDVPGHAMKVTDHAKAQGAILGKSMTSLPEGKGMVLVLVTLQ